MAAAYQRINAYRAPTDPDALVDSLVGATLTILPPFPPGIDPAGAAFVVLVQAPDGSGGELMRIDSVGGTGNLEWTIGERATGYGNPGTALSHAHGDSVILVQTAETLNDLSAWDSLTGVPATFPPDAHDNTVHTTTGTPGSSAVGDAAAQGSSASVARLDHTHGREAFATPTDLGDANAAGSATTLPHSDHVHKRTVRVQKAGSDVGTRNKINLIEGSNVTITASDDGSGDKVDITIASTGGSGGAPTTASYLTVNDEAGLSAEQSVRNLLMVNEFYWPLPAVALEDLDASGLWWRKVGTPTGGVIYTGCAAAGIANVYGDRTLKCVAAASGDGLKSTWTYANEQRVKSGAYQAILCAVYLVTSARTVTISLVDSTAATIASATVTTTGSWQLVALEPGTNTLAGTSVDFKATLSGAGTFYVIPLSALVSTAASPRAIPLPPRPTVWIDSHNNDFVSNVDPGGTTWTTATAVTGPLCLRAQVLAFYRDTTAGGNVLYVRRKGTATAQEDSAAITSNPLAAGYSTGTMIVPTDDQGRIEYGTTAAAGHAESVYLSTAGYEAFA